jgi:L-seryl-tRNA(Ser) seleniumtransferase
MKNPFGPWNRRAFLSSSGLASIAAAGFRPRYVHAAQMASEHGEIYRQLGVRPLINAAGTYTVLTGSVMPERARRAMEAASRSFVHCRTCEASADCRQTARCGVSHGHFRRGLFHYAATAACVTGTDTERFAAFPTWPG